VVRVSGVTCREVLGVAPPNVLEGSLVGELEEKDMRGFPKHFTVTARYRTAPEEAAETGEYQPPGHSVRWRCTTSYHKVRETHGRFVQEQIWLACSHVRQRAEVRFLYRPFLA
jgi:hypothetical protein